MADAEYFKLDDGTVLAVADATARQKIGSDTLDTEAQDLSGAVNELKGTLDDKSNKFITRSYSHAFNINANGYMFWNPQDSAGDNINISGYSIVGIVQLATNNWNIVYINVTTDNSAYGMFLRNISNDSQSGTFSYKVLYVAND